MSYVTPLEEDSGSLGMVTPDFTALAFPLADFALYPLALTNYSHETIVIPGSPLSMRGFVPGPAVLPKSTDAQCLIKMT